MAKQTIKHSCGHLVEHNLYGPSNDRVRKAGWLREQPCRQCQIEATNAAAAEATEAMALPALTGSAKQVAWATTIRVQQLSAAQEWIDRQLAMGRAQNAPAAEIAKAEAMLAAAVESLKRHTDAGWWIDRRNDGAQAMLRGEM
jgi:hypothetical protein